MQTALRLIGVGASPYTRKIRAVLRYRRIPYQFVIAGSEEEKQLPKRPKPLVPGLALPTNDGFETISDSTPIINRLEVDFSQRALRPKNSALRFIDSLIEDYGDEWLSKCMFHYRWSHSADTNKASSYLPYTTMMTAATDAGQKMGKAFAERQISRIGVVGSNQTTAPIIEASWARYLQIFEAHIQNQSYFLGERPGAGDFACFGQMTMLVITDPTPMAVANEISPRAYAWTERLEDLSGITVNDSCWIEVEEPPSTLLQLLTEIGRVYVPFLLANGAAITRGDPRVECEIDGQPWEQEAFVYQAKCLRWLQEEYQALASEARVQVDEILAGTGCEALFCGA